ncbi:hypothetical protein SAMN05660653_00137 [Desulfonatronum thiosulfatophilum]|uniref:Methyl-accepting transducer domain-containing protein n=2 Tax=Desulfonatronum thiosulfatophilum TaxID=617002 RepID=A0A1G6A4M9_9BACT|nr:hypothetical protein SAMN05660653_00137 [Desulfonatronum thiosulfatophilum]
MVESMTHTTVDPDRFLISIRQWGSVLERLDQELSQVIPAREEDFLALGANIQAYTSKSRKMAREAADLTTLTGGEEISQIVETLGYELNQINEVCGFTSRETDLRRLEKVVRLISSLETRTGSFRKIVRTLQMLGVTTRIESARLGEKGRGFMNLAGQVDSLGQNIIDHWNKIVNDTKILHEHVTSALHRTGALVREQRSVTEEALSSGHKNLETLVRLTDQSGAASQTLSSRTSEISSHVGSIVSSLQFHDIARQQVEHVCEAVEDMTQMLLVGVDGEGEDAETKMQDLACWIADVCSLQVSQLRQCGVAFEQAIETLTGNLSSITDTVAAMDRDLRAILGAEDNSSHNALDQIEANVHLLIDFMQGYSAKSEELADIMRTVGDMVSQMAAYVANIEEVGAEIELIALNASVQAAHTGEEGLALGVLAGAIQRLSMDARTLTDVVADELRDISEHAHELLKLADISVNTQKLGQQVGRLEEMISSLRTLNQQTVQTFSEVRAMGAELKRDLLDQIEAITFHHPMLAELRQAGDAFMELANQALEHSSRDCDPADRPERLKVLLSRYTMEAERMVHLGLDQDEADAAQDDSGVDLFGDDDGVELFGDDSNVELFDDDSRTSKKPEQREEDLGDNVELF